jgi:succinate dehydrogenase flavoprotein subunit
MGGVWVRPEDHGTGVEGLYAIPDEIAALIHDVSSDGKLVE